MKVALLHNETDRVNAISSTHNFFLRGSEKIIPTFLWQHSDRQQQGILGQSSKAAGAAIPNVKTNYRAAKIKTKR